MSRSTALAALASHIDALLLNPANMARERELAEVCLAEPEHVNALFPEHPDNPFPDRDLNVVQTPGQRALAFAAIHDVYCAGVEKVVAVPRDLTRGAVLADDQLIPAWLRAFRWAMILDEARGLGNWAMPWFELQMRRFEQEFCEPECDVPTSPPTVGTTTGEAPPTSPPTVGTTTGEAPPKQPAKPDPVNIGLAFLIEAHRKGAKPTAKELAHALGIKRQPLYENKLFAPVRDMANTLFGLFEKEAKNDWQVPRGSKHKDGTMEAVDPATDSDL